MLLAFPPFAKLPRHAALAAMSAAAPLAVAQISLTPASVNLVNLCADTDRGSLATFNIERAEGRGRVDAGRIPDWSWTVNGKPLSSQPHYTAYAMHEGEILLLALKPDCPVPATFQIRVTDRNGFEGSAEATARVLPRLLLTPAEATVISGNGRPFWVRRGDGQRYTRCEAEVLEPGGGSMALSEDGHWRYHAPMVQSPTWFTLQIRDRDRPELTAQARVKVLPAFTSIQDMDPD